MKAAAFRYERVTTIDDACRLLAADEDAKCLAGGQSLVPMLSMRLARPSTLVDLGSLDQLRYIRASGDSVEVGAMTTQRTAERSPTIRNYIPLLATAIGHIGHVGIRNRGTVGGSAAHADASAEIPSALTALDAVLVAVGPSGVRREIPAAEFFCGFMTNALAPGEVLTAVRIPGREVLDRQAVVEFARRSGDFAICGIFVAARLESGTIADPRIVVSGVSRTPVRLPAAEGALTAEVPTPALFAKAAQLPLPVEHVRSDVHGSAAFRRELAQVLIRRALAGAFAITEDS